ncbi:exo-alpha-sialidase [Aquincola sp. S2]|uniref:Exo-alpha-sialidase n=1 Tax=Pseudaquabacterium terrae TaxID=2732868 RepID=A0ABX2ESJ8_9BURK|nr:exo-alpha-sialidase [Aquabacterium terrae]NRF71675.1 exo-alpha-sialidase [Aquabacterium terrae]
MTRPEPAAPAIAMAPLLPRRRLLLGAACAAGGAVVHSAPAPEAPMAALEPKVPTAASYQWHSVPFGAGGFVTGFLFHPRERGLLYLRTDIGGAYRFNDAAQAWVPLLDHLSKADADLMGVLSLAVDVNDPDRLYAACGLYLDERVRRGALLSSTDRGASWQVHELGIHLGGNSPGRGSGERLQVDPHDGRVLWLGSSRDGLFKSTDRGRSFRPAGLAARHVSCVLLDPASGTPGNACGTLYAGSHDQPGLYVSHDFGQSFERVAATPRQAPQQAAFGPDGALYVSFALGEAAVACNPSYARTGSVWKRDTDGRWSEITPERPAAGPGPGRRGFGYAGLDIGPHGRLVVSTIERHGEGDEIFLSDDGGAQWTALGPHSRHEAGGHPWLQDYMRSERNLGHWTSAVRIDPFDRDRALYGTGYGVWQTRRLGAAAQGGPVPWVFTVSNLEETATLEIRSPAAGARLLAAVGDVAGGAWSDPARPLGSGFFTPTKETNRSIDFAELAPAIIVRTGDRPARGHWSDDGGRRWQSFATPPIAGRGHTGRIAVSARGSAFVFAQRGEAVCTHDRGLSWLPCRGWPQVGDEVLPPVADRAADGVFYVHDRDGGRVLVSNDGGRHFEPLLTELPRLRRDDFSQLISAPGAEGALWLALHDRLLHRPGPGLAPRTIAAVDEAWMVALGRGAAGAAHPHSLYLWGRVHQDGGAVEGLFRSDDGGERFVRINDDRHRYGRLLSMAGDAREHGVLYIAPHGRGVVAGRPAAAR